jgi:hypothetical protein
MQKRGDRAGDASSIRFLNPNALLRCTQTGMLAKIPMPLKNRVKKI